MIKRVISICIIAAMLMTVVPAISYAADSTNPQIYINETFEGFAENETPGGYSIQGLDARVVTIDGSKALYSKLWGSGFMAKMPISGKSDQMVYSFNVRITGDKVVGSALKISSSANLFKYMPTGGIELESGLVISGYADNFWHKYTAVVDYSTGRYSLYADGDSVFINRKFSSTPSTSASIDFLFQSAEDDGMSELYIDNVRVYDGNKILKENEFPYIKPNNEVFAFEATADKPDTSKVFINSSGKAGLDSGVITFVQKENNEAGWASIKEGGQEYIHFSQSGTQDCFANLTMDATGSQNLVFELDIYPEFMETTTADILRTEGSAGYSNLLTLSGFTLSTNGSSIGKLTAGKWTHITVLADFLNGTADYYVDGVLRKSDAPMHNGSVIPDKDVRIALRTITSTGRNSFFMNNIKIYEGKEVRELPEVDGSTVQETPSNENSLGLTTIQTTKAQAARKIGSDSVFMTSNNAYYSLNQKKTYPQGKEAYETANGVKMVAADVLSDTLALNIVCTDTEVAYQNKKVKIGEISLGNGSELDAAPEVKDGTVFVPAASFAKLVLGKYVYDDSRGMLVVSNSPLNLSNSTARADVMEDSDIIFRYLLYDRPTGGEIYDLIQNNIGGAHPRLFVTADRIPAIRAKVEKSPELKKELKSLIEECEELMDTPPVPYNIPDGLRLIYATQNITDRIVNLTVANIVTGDSKYLDRIWLEVKNAFTYPDWNVNKHYLDSGEIGPGMALAYDMLYNHITESERQYFRDQFEKYFLDFAVGVYTGRSSYTAYDTRQLSSNWAAVIGNAHLMCAIAMIDSESEDSEFTEKCKFLAENALQTIEIPFGGFIPDGAIDEGPGYWGFYAKNLSYSVQTMLNSCGDDFGLLDSPGYRKVPDSLLYAQSALGYYPYGSAGDGNGVGSFMNCEETMLISKLYGDYAKMEACKDMTYTLRGSLGAKALLWYEPDMVDTTEEYPLDYMFQSIQMSIMKSEWHSRDALYVGVIGGEVSNVNHFDKGSFIMDADGVRWFSDLNAEDYNLGVDRRILYRRRAEGHNCVVINPTAASPGQVEWTWGPVVRFDSKPKGAISVYDLSEVYGDNVKSYKRGFYLGDNRKSLVVQDEIDLLNNNSDVYSFYHTTGKVEILPDKKSALITSEGKTLKAEFISDAKDWHIELRDTTPFFEENIVPGERSRAAYSKITYVTKASGKVNISVKFTMVNDLETYTPHTFTPIDTWTIPDGEVPPKPEVSNIYVNGVALESYNSNVYEYTLPVIATDAMPVFTADSPDGEIVVEMPDSFDGKVRIIAQNSNGKRAYTIKFKFDIIVADSLMNIKPQDGIPANSKQLDVAYCYADNNPQLDNCDTNAVDGDLNTRWSSNVNPSFLEVDLGETKDLSGIAIAYMDSNRFYKYDILVSNDKINYTRIYSGTSSGLKNTWDFLPAKTSARYVRYVGYGHQDGEWNSVIEFRPCS